MHINESIQIFYDDQRSYVVQWEPTFEPIGVIVFIHGLGEHIRRYDDQFQFFTTQGYTILAADLPAHGRSEGERGVWPSLEPHYKVIEGLLSLARNKYAGLPVLIYGHSMGANLAAGYVNTFLPKLHGLILTGIAIKTPNDLPKALIRFVLAAPRWIKNIAISNRLNLKSLSHDADIIKRYTSDPLVHDRISLGAGASILSNAFKILETDVKPDYPVLVMHGADDTITFPEGSRLLKQKWPEAELKVWPDLLHEIHNEPNKAEVWSYTMQWIDQLLKK